MLPKLGKVNDASCFILLTPSIELSMQLLGLLAQLILGTDLLSGGYLPLSTRRKNLIIDTDLFSDVEYDEPRPQTRDVLSKC